MTTEEMINLGTLFNKNFGGPYANALYHDNLLTFRVYSNILTINKNCEDVTGENKNYHAFTCGITLSSV